MLNLKTDTWVRFLVWMAVGLAVYGLYGRWHSRLANEDQWDFDDTDPGTGGLRAVGSGGRVPAGGPQAPLERPRGRHMRR